MILSTHAVVGGTIAAVLKTNPITSFFAGFISHFVLDAFPHWEYSLLSGSSENDDPMKANMKIGKNFVIDAIKISADLAIGLLIVFIFFKPEIHSLGSFFSSPILWGVAGSVLPDFLQFAYFKIKKEPLTSLQYFHKVIVHSKKSLDHRHILGPSIQIAIILLCVLVYHLIQ